MSKRALISWALYDSGASAFGSLIQTFIFASYFTRKVAPNEVIGSSQWGLVLGMCGVLIALGGPFLGAIADHKGYRKTWMGIFYCLCLVSTALMWYVKPNPTYLPLALVLIFLSTLGSEFAFIFYNAMLPDLAPTKNIGKWSGIAWGLGYVGGMSCLVIALIVFLNQEHSLWFIENHEESAVRATFILTALWYGLFAIPLFLFTPPSTQKNETLRRAISLGFNQIKTSCLEIHRYKNLLWFFLARMIYTDGLTTLFLFVGVYAASTFNMSAHEVLIYAIAANVAAGIGAFCFAWVDDWIGSKVVIMLSLAALSILTGLMLLSTTLTAFWILSLLVALFIGPLQSSSRAFLAKVTPKDKVNQMFGLFAFSGKATGFIGPFIVSLIVHVTTSLRLGVSTLIPFFLMGFFCMLRVPSEKKFGDL